MARRIAPAYLLIAVAAIAVVYAVWVIWVSHDQPWLGLRLAPRAGGAVTVVGAEGPGAAVPVGTVLTRVEGGGDELVFVPRDWVPEPDGSIGSFADYEVFLARWDRMATMQDGDALTFTSDRGARFTIHPEAQRPVLALPLEFWVQLAVGLFAWLISGAIWAFRPRDTPARYLLLGGFATALFAPLAAIYTTRELGMHTFLFRWTNDINFLGGQLFTAALFALLLYYPRRVAPRWVGVAVVAVFTAWFVAQQVGVFPNMTDARRLLVMVGLVAILALSAYHWRTTRKDPVARAALQWFLLSWLVGVALFAGLILLPQLFGVDTSAYQGYAFLLFLLVYVGLAFGITRFKLFELGEWWVRVVVWTVGVFVLIAADLMFLFALGLSRGESLVLALAITAVVWLPLRAWLWGRIVTRTERAGERSVFRDVIEVGFTAHVDARARRWRQLLARVFDPLDVRTGPEVAAPEPANDGAALRLPAVAGTPPLELAFARGGRRLFNRGDLALAGELIGMLDHVVASRTAYEQGVAMERKRIARDLHDNLGTPLANALHAADGRKDQLIRDTLSDLRTIINDVRRPGSTFAQALAELRLEIIERTRAAGLELDWPLAALPAESPLLATTVHAVRSIVREAVHNAIKHAHATRVAIRVTCTGGAVELAVEDDGAGFDPAAAGDGIGLASIAARAAACGGDATWSAGAGGKGTRLVARLVEQDQTSPSRTAATAASAFDDTSSLP